ncbi:MAG: endonuclease NucS [Oscillatoria sp. PMC 1068.18]|nr:endonuclease NucS [Oscillatoria sp. PMC 1068.18]
MILRVNLNNTSKGWQFDSEAVLEDFVWDNLETLLGLTPLERQYSVNGQYCDLIALGENQQLVVIELKNTEDRYIVQQLTRYYDALQVEKPFIEKIDYSKPVHIVAIAPSFHRDNFIDIKYHKLSFQLLKLEIISVAEKLYFNLQDVETESEISKIEMFHQEQDNPDSLPAPPKVLTNFFNKCPVERQNGILKVREQILNFDRRMQEFTDSGSIKYGDSKGKASKVCAEFSFDSKGNLTLFLWLPLKGLTSERIGRARIWTDWQDNALVEGYVSKGIGTKISSRKRAISFLLYKIKNKAKPSQKWRVKLVDGSYSQIELPQKSARQFFYECNEVRKKIEKLQPITNEEVELYFLFPKYVFGFGFTNFTTIEPPYLTLKNLVSLSLEKWFKRF